MLQLVSIVSSLFLSVYCFLPAHSYFSFIQSGDEKAVAKVEDAEAEGDESDDSDLPVRVLS